jgi:hypothetical protein
MYEEIYEYFPLHYGAKPKSHQRQFARGQWRALENQYHVSMYGFQCRHCQAYVYTQPMISGVQNRNHCPYCLWSRHVDHIQPGDRMSACKAIMQPIGLTVKRSLNKYGVEKAGELMLIHCCKDCGKLSINRIAADDQVERLMELYKGSLSLEANTRDQLDAIGIHLLLADDAILVVSQLRGKSQI